MKQILEKKYFYLYSILLFFTPLVMSIRTNESFEFPKMYFVYLLGLFIIALFVSDIISKPIKIKKPSIYVICFFAITTISTLLSSNLQTSFFGYYTRFNDGFLSYLVFFGLYLVGINKIDSEEFKKILKISLFSIIPLSLYGLSQYFGSPNILWSGESLSRVYSTLGQPNWLAQYFSMSLLVCLFFLFTEEKNFSKWFLIYALGFYCFWLTYSMSGLSGFTTGMLFLFIYLSKKSKENINGGLIKDVKIRVTLVLIISFFIALSNPGILKMKINDAVIDIKKQVSLVKKVYAQTDNNYMLSDPGFIRMELWKSTLNLIKSSPKIFFIGTGPETFPYVFQSFRKETLNYSSEWNFVFNKPHNYYLEIISESGIFAFLSYLLIIYFIFKSPNKIIVFPSIALFVSNMFGWPSVSISLFFWFFLVGISLEKENEKVEEKEIFDRKDGRKLVKIILLPVVWLIFASSSFFLGRIYIADVFFKNADDLIQANDDTKSLFYINKAIELNPNEPTYYRERAKINTVFLAENEKEGVDSNKDKIRNYDKVKEDILNDLEKAKRINPSNLVVIRNSIPVYYFLAIKDLNKQVSKDNIDQKYFEIVRNFIEGAKKSYWNDAGVISLAAKYEKKLGLENEFNESVERIKFLRPDLLEWFESFKE